MKSWEPICVTLVYSQHHHPVRLVQAGGAIGVCSGKAAVRVRARQVEVARCRKPRIPAPRFAFSVQEQENPNVKSYRGSNVSVCAARASMMLSELYQGQFMEIRKLGSWFMDRRSRRFVFSSARGPHFDSLCMIIHNSFVRSFFISFAHHNLELLDLAYRLAVCSSCVNRGKCPGNLVSSICPRWR